MPRALAELISGGQGGRAGPSVQKQYGEVFKGWDHATRRSPVRQQSQPQQHPHSPGVHPMQALPTIDEDAQSEPAAAVGFRLIDVGMLDTFIQSNFVCKQCAEQITLAQ